MKTTIHQRFEIMIKSLGMTKNSFAGHVGVASTQVYNIINGRNAPSHDMYERIGSTFPTVNLTWLIVGRGPVLSAPNEKITQESQDLVERLRIVEEQLEKLSKPKKPKSRLAQAS